VILEGVDERAPGAFEKDARPALPKGGIEFRAVEAAPLAMNITVKRVPADMAARGAHESHQGCALPAKVP